MRCPATKDGEICIREAGHADNLFPDGGHNWQEPYDPAEAVKRVDALKTLGWEIVVDEKDGA